MSSATNFFSLGVEELDELLGLIEPGSVVLLEGAPGTGKTSLALSAVMGNVVKKGLKAAYILVGEVPEKLYRNAESIGIPLRAMVSRGEVLLKKIPLVNDPEIIGKLTELVVTQMREYRVVVVDSIAPLIKLLIDYGSKRSWIQTALYDFASVRDSLLILVADKISENDADLKMLEYVSDAVLELAYVQKTAGALERFINVKKFRGREVMITSIPFEITPKGIITLNYVTGLQKGRDSKPLRLTCEVLGRILPQEILPGRSVLIVNRTGRAFIYTHFMWALAQELLRVMRAGSKVGVITFDPELAGIISKLRDRESFSNLKVSYINPLIIDPPKVTRVEIELIKDFGVEVLVISNSERVFHAYLSDEEVLYKYAVYAIHNLKSAGVITLRYLDLSPEEPIPRAYRDWVDIIVEIKELPNGENIIRHVKSVVPVKESSVPDSEFMRCVTDETMAEKMDKYVTVHSGVRYSIY
ncbi:MAG: hypothetical protein J7L55_02060 [Desulfurococcales archaeon]|nr:hypothetical protein [Desulfurococcales archaeon]